MRFEESKLLRDSGFKATPGRISILEIFSKHCKPINAEYIHGKLKGNTINRVTIYRTLSSLEQAGIIKRVDLRKDSVFYELTAHHHHHLVCTNCGTTEGFESCNIESITKEALKKSSLFKSANQHSLELFGLCKFCSKN